MKRFLHALAALWPKRKEVGNPPAPPTSTGLRQHLAAVLRMERALCGFADSPIRGFAEETVGASALSTVRDQLPESPDTRLVDSPDTRLVDSPDTRLPESSTQQLTESPDTRLIESPDTRLDDSPNQQFVDSPNQPHSLPRIPQPMPLLTILMLVFFMCLMAAPSRVFGSAAFLDSIPESAIRPLQIGDTIPEELWHLPLQVVNHPEGKETITLNDYRGKLIILDFWSTWCSTCISGMPKLFRIKNSLQDHVSVIPITYQSQATILNFADENPTILKIPGFYSVVEDGTFRSAFNITGLPNAGVISKDGKVESISRPKYITEENLSLYLNHPDAVAFPLTRTMEDIRDKPLLMPTYTSKLYFPNVYYSALISHMPGLIGHDLFEVDTVSNKIRFFISDKHLLELYALAMDELDLGFDKFPNRRLIQQGVCLSMIPKNGRFDVSGEARLEWERNYLFNYEYLGPHEQSKEDILSALQHDLNRLLNSHASIQMIEMDCLVLEVRTGGFPHFRERSRPNRSISSLVNLLNQGKFGLPPVLNGTDHEEWPELKIPENIFGLEEVNKVLDCHGLVLTPAKRDLEMFVLGRHGFNPRLPFNYQLTEFGFISTH